MLEVGTVLMLKQRDQDVEILKPEIEFYRVREVEDQFHKDSEGLDLTHQNSRRHFGRTGPGNKSF
jgi:hypothetical protein